MTRLWCILLGAQSITCRWRLDLLWMQRRRLHEGAALELLARTIGRRDARPQRLKDEGRQPAAARCAAGRSGASGGRWQKGVATNRW